MKHNCLKIQEIRELVRRKPQDGLSYSKISHQLKLSKSIVHDMIQNNYEKLKKQIGPEKKIYGFEQVMFRRSIAALKQKKVKTTASKIKKGAILEVSIRTVHQALYENRYQKKNGQKLYS